MGWHCFTGQANVTGANAVILWSAILLALLLVLFFLYNQLKRWMRQPDQPTTTTGFTLSDLRELHRQGKMSDEEFEKTKAKIVASAKRVTEQMPEVLGRKRKSGEENPGEENRTKSGEGE